MPKEMQDALQEKIRPYHNALSFKCGAVEAWEYLAPELAAIRGERDAYKKVLEDIAINLYPAPISLAKKALEQYSSPKSTNNE